MARLAGKAKTRKSVSKRFKITGSGKVQRRKSGKRHLLRKKNSKKRRNMRKATLLHKPEEKAVKMSMPFA